MQDLWKILKSGLFYVQLFFALLKSFYNANPPVFIAVTIVTLIIILIGIKTQHRRRH